MKRPILISILCIITILSSSSLMSPAYAQGGNWQLIYENDAAGKTVQGALETLLTAVRAGKEIRIGWSSQRPDNPKIKVEHMANAKFLTIMSDAIVFAQIDPIIGQTPQFEQQEVILKENLEWSMIAGSNGKSDSIMRNTASGKIEGHNKRPRGIKWFVFVD